MAKKPVLVVLAAGMGSRYGGLKQIDPVGSQGEAILDYSIYDAHQAGFDTVVIIIKEAIKKDFLETVGKRLEKAPVEILPGTVIHIPANVKHWHGAAADSWFAHLAFEVPGEKTSNEWLEPVMDEEYNKLEQTK